LGEPSTNALVTSPHAASLLAEQNARREAGFSPRPIRLVARVSHGLVNTRGIADEFNPAPTAAKDCESYDQTLLSVHGAPMDAMTRHLQTGGHPFRPGNRRHIGR
jgi:hypothetical protein